ncbi:hypothetical protein [Lacticaseibacillus parakribbianus]|uniref:hypothetical protein n=1 Tax=Lacticaseibacillus parakribbianus TaxID=2970927 RepID=UPI0021CB6D60|nr:hypothetical protein [Lacticaseibacillus parakribbianus]
MQTDQYVQCVNQELERLLVFETVFKEYFHTCKNIEKGNCYASESFERLHLYLSKNILRYNRFVDQCAKVTAPRGYEEFNRRLIEGLQGIRNGVLLTLMAIEPDKLDASLFNAGLTTQKQARDAIDQAFSHIQVAAS